MHIPNVNANANANPKPDADPDADDGANVDGGAVTHADRDGAPITAEEQLDILKDTMGSRSLKEMEKLLAAGMTREQVPQSQSLSDKHYHHEITIAIVFFSFLFWMCRSLSISGSWGGRRVRRVRRFWMPWRRSAVRWTWRCETGDCT